MAAQRPSGVTILAVLQLIGGVLALILGISIVFLGSILFASAVVVESPDTGEVGAIFWGIGVGSLISGLIGLVAAYGLFALKGWGWWLAVFFAIINIIQSIIAIFQEGVVIGILSLVISGLILYYLNKSNVKRAFGRI